MDSANASRAPSAPQAQVDAPAVVETIGLTRRFGRRVAVEDLNLSVQRGEILGLVGPDGAGKTTALRLMAGLLTPSGGHARVFGHDPVRAAGQVKRHTGYVSQRFSLYGDLTVLENILFFADLFAVAAADRAARIERLLRFAGLGDFRHRRAALLSGGMLRKLALACVLIHTPDLVLLDEPTTGVDPVSRREFWEILGELHMQGVTLVISTPYMDEAEQCTRVGLMIQGKMVVCDSPAHIREMTRGEAVALWTDDSRRARDALLGVPGLYDVQMFGDQLRILAQDAEGAIGAIAQVMRDKGIAVRDLRRTRVRMEEAFVSLIGHWRDHSAGQGC